MLVGVAGCKGNGSKRRTNAPTTRYPSPIPCGATCSASGADKRCVCEINCRSPMYFREPVCGSDGNTYRSECQLRQYSCRIQKEVAITVYGPCRDAPTSIYGGNSAHPVAPAAGPSHRR